MGGLARRYLRPSNVFLLRMISRIIPIAVENQYPVPTWIAAFGSVLYLAFGSDADTAEACSLESRSDQRQVTALGYIYLLFHSVSC